MKSDFVAEGWLRKVRNAYLLKIGNRVLFPRPAILSEIERIKEGE